jgi:8-oxo-dGTP diphosphatase
MIHCHFDEGYSMDLRHVTATALIMNENNQILLIKRAVYLSNPNKWALPGGYLDHGERIGEGIIREVLEETGYKGQIISLFFINDNPRRPQEDKQNVEFVFLVKVDKKVQEHDQEVQEVKWFSLKNLPSKDLFAYDHFEDIQLYLQHLKIPKILPMFSL